MAANVESVAYFGQTPWYGWGEKVDHAMTSAEAIRLAGLDWEVQSKKVQVAGGAGIPGYKANVRATDGKILGLVTDRYKIVQNSEAFAFTDELLGEGVRYETAGSLSSGKRIWLLARMDTTKVCGDDVEPYLVFTNSHDGTGAIKVACVSIRVVCQNTLTLALKSAKRTWSARHQGDIAGKMEDARQTLGLATKYMEALKQESDEMTQIVITNPLFMEYLNKMFPVNDKMSDRQKNNVLSQRDTFKEIYNNKDDIQKFKGTAYGLALAATDFVPHVKPGRLSSTYRENNFMSIVDGNNLITDTTKFIYQIV